MKKTIFTLFCILLLCGCTYEDKTVYSVSSLKQKIEEQPSQVFSSSLINRTIYLEGYVTEITEDEETSMKGVLLSETPDGEAEFGCYHDHPGIPGEDIVTTGDFVRLTMIVEGSSDGYVCIVSEIEVQ